MNSCYAIEDTSHIITPGMILFREIMERNIDGMIQMAGGIARLRPHCKTHKMREVIQLQLERGIKMHKAATLAEVEMLADVGVNDICLAYSMVGPNIDRAVRMVAKYPDVELRVTADHAGPIEALAQAMSAAGRSIGVLLDIDTGQHRTGIEVGPAARTLYEQIVRANGLKAVGFHVYDGHQHQSSRTERAAAVNAEWDRVVAFRDELVAAGFPVPTILAGGTGSCPIYAEKEDPTIELSPGTCVFYDQGYVNMFPDLSFTPAAVLLTRVISRPTADRITLDLGYKAIASDPPMGKRMVFPDLPDATQVLQNEEHLVLESTQAEQFQPGDTMIAIPWHVCPSTAMHKEVTVVENRRVTERWTVAARDRSLTI